jgi:8-oxo-dGTP pyrophosphatase MutT (NUDIX family)
MEIAEARHAATVVLVRNSPKGPELFMVQRHHGNKFMANAHVFVGGRVDDEDSAADLLACCTGLNTNTAAERLGLANPSEALGVYVAALRETFEESGVFLGDGATALGSTELALLRENLNEKNADFLRVLVASKLTLRPDRLRYLARWVTPEFEARRFDARFFVAQVAEDQEASFDRRETTAGDWFTIESLLAANRAKQVLLAPPTLAVLQDLSVATSAEEMLDLCPDAPVDAICPRPLTENSAELTLLLPGDHRFDDQQSAEGNEDCVVLRDGYWQRIKN